MGWFEVEQERAFAVKGNAPVGKNLLLSKTRVQAGEPRVFQEGFL